MNLLRTGALLVALGGCATTSSEQGTATAEVHSAAGTRLGVLSFVAENGTTRIRGTLENVPAGTHGLHIHAVGECTPPFTTAGPHFNPTGVPHGRAQAQGGHAGDLPNVVAAADGRVQVDAVARAPLRGNGGILDADGAAVVLHENADDERTDPAGNAGARIACGVIRLP